MTRTLVVTNDFPPRQGGIQTFVAALLAPGRRSRSWSSPPTRRGRPSTTPRCPIRSSAGPPAMLLPTPGTARAAADLARRHGCDSAFFGAAAPLGLLAPALRSAGVRHLVGATHGHETGWVALPGSPAAAAAHRAGPRRPHLHQRVHPRPARTRAGRPDAAGPALARGRRRPVHAGRRRRRRPAPVRAGGGAGRRLRLPAGRAQGPGRAGGGLAARPGPPSRRAAAARRRRPRGGLAAAGGRGPRPRGLRRPHRADRHRASCPRHYAAGDVFAMPCRTRRGRAGRRGPRHGLPRGRRVRPAGGGRHLRRRAGDGAGGRHRARGRPAVPGGGRRRPRGPARRPRPGPGDGCGRPGLGGAAVVVDDDRGRLRRAARARHSD